jgi:dihydrofolate synthase/folylpolyglutamate synthase
MQSYKDALDYVYNLGGKLGIPAKYGLEKIEKVLTILDNPQEGQNSIHVTGTKGKGSTTNYLSFMLRRNHFNVGMYISPSLINTSERISINGLLISPRDFLSLTNRLKQIYDTLPKEDIPSTFETFTIIAFLYFKEHFTDISLLEVGLGGRLDATNVIKRPLVSAITEISFDHEKILGNTLAQIAFEKAGIVKEGRPVVIGSEIPEGYEMIVKTAQSKHSHYFLLGKDFYPTHIGLSKEGSIFDFESPSLGVKIKDLHLKIAGLHQVKNASVSLQTMLLLKDYGFTVKEEAMRVGLSMAFWPARFEVIRKKPTVILDGAHNDASSIALYETLKLMNKKVVFLFSVLQDKNIDKIVKNLAPIASSFVITEVPLSYGRRTDVNILKEHVKQFIEPSKIFVCKDPRKAYQIAYKSLTSNDVLCVTGSLYFVGFIREIEKIFTFSCDML